jgi:polygalacturonase
MEGARSKTLRADRWLLALAWLLSASCFVRGEMVYNVRGFGAKGDGTTLDTVAIQKALDEAGKACPATVIFQPGTYLSKPLVLRDRTTLKLEAGAILKATDEPADFADPAKPQAFVPFIGGKKLRDITIAGPGVIDGSGSRWWVPAEAARRKTPGFTLPRPRLILLNGCRNVRVENITLQNSPTFHFVPTDCEDVVVTNVTITAPPDSPNTDAIDPSASKNVLITHCVLDVGDDNVAIKAGHAVAGRTAASEDITVTDCTCLHGHGISIGSETPGGVRHVVVQRCTFQDTENGLRIKSPRGRGGKVEDVFYSDITMTNVDPAITITCYYPKIPSEDSAQPVTETTPSFHNIQIKNLTATCRRNAGVIVGLPESPVTQVKLENVQISAATTGLLIKNAKGVELKDATVTATEGPPVIIQNAEVKGAQPAAHSERQASK